MIHLHYNHHLNYKFLLIYSQIPAEIVSSGQSLLVRFKSDDTINWKGFSATYEQVSLQSQGSGVIKPLPMT